MGRVRQVREKRGILDGMMRKGLFVLKACSAQGTPCRAAVCGGGMSGEEARGSSMFSRRCEGKPDVFSFAPQIAYPAPEGREALCGCQG